MIGLLTIAGIIGLTLRNKKGVGTPAWISGISGLKHYYLQHGLGKAKYIVNYTDGIKRHRDGSVFYDIAIFRNKKEMEGFIRELKRDGYVSTWNSLPGLAELEKWYLRDVDYIELEPIDDKFVYSHFWYNDGTGGTTTIDYETANNLIRLYNAQWI